METAATQPEIVGKTTNRGVRPGLSMSLRWHDKTGAAKTRTWPAPKLKNGVELADGFVMGD